MATTNQLNRRGIKRLLALHPVYKLCQWYGISQPSLRKYLAGQNPKSAAVTEKINNETERLLHAGRDELAVLRKYVNDFANHRVSVDESKPGVDCKYTVLRYAVGDVYSRFDVASNTLYLGKVHFGYWLGETCPDHKQLKERLTARGLMGESALTRLNMLEGTGLPAATMDAYQIDLARQELGMLQELLLESAAKDDPSQNGKTRTRIEIGPSQPLDGAPVPAILDRLQTSTAGAGSPPPSPTLGGDTAEA